MGLHVGPLGLYGAMMEAPTLFKAGLRVQGKWPSELFLPRVRQAGDWQALAQRCLLSISGGHREQDGKLDHGSIKIERHVWA